MSLLNRLRPLVLAAGLAGLTTGCSNDTPVKDDNILIEYQAFGKTHKIHVLPDFFTEVPGFTKELLLEYGPKLGHGILQGQDLFKMGMTPQTVNLYDHRFTGQDIFDLCADKIHPELANRYDQRFEGWQIRGLHTQNITPQVANAYDSRFNNHNIVKLHKAEVLPAVANAYAKDFDTDGIITLFTNGIADTRAQHYHTKGFRNADQIVAVDKHVAFEATLDMYLALNTKYGTLLNGFDIAQLVRAKIPFEEVEKAAREHMLREAMK